jgi:hypothetical protein
MNWKARAFLVTIQFWKRESIFYSFIVEILTAFNFIQKTTIAKKMIMILKN